MAGTLQCNGVTFPHPPLTGANPCNASQSKIQDWQLQALHKFVRQNFHLADKDFSSSDKQLIPKTDNATGEAIK